MTTGSQQQRARKQKRATPDRQKGLTSPFDKTVHSYASYLTASFSALPETNAGTLAAAILISLPVCGLRPVRSARWFTLKVPKPTSLYSIAFFQRLSNSSQSGFQSSFSLGFGQFCFVCNYINQLSLVHKLSLQCVYRLLSIECDGNARKALSCIHAPIATFFRLPNVDQTGGIREALWHDKSDVKSRFLVSLLKIYTDIALTSLAQVCPEPFYQFNIAFFAVG